MSQYGVIYRMQWNTVPSVMSSTLTIPAQTIIVNIYDTETLIDDADTPVVIPLLAAANPLVIKIINNDEDKFSPIRAKQAVIQFISDSPAFEDVTTFSDSSDNRWYVLITADGTTVFVGYLMLPDSQMDFLPDPNVVVLTASDHLALLKDVPLTTDAGLNPTGKQRIAELIALCLKKTGLSLDIIVINNLRHGSGTITQTASFITSPNEVITSVTNWFYVGQRVTVTGTASNNVTFNVLAIGQSIVTIVVVDTPLTSEANVLTTFTDTTSSLHFYDGVYLDIKTFEKEIGVSEFCYTVLEKILGEDCFLTQWLGKWYIMRVDEYDGNPIYPAEFDADGLFVAFNTPTDYSKNIGEGEQRRFANADALLRFDRPNNFIQETFDFRFPEEIPDNVDYTRGAVTTRVVQAGYTAYNFDDWGIGNLWGSAETTPTIDAVILRSFNAFGDEITRFVMLTQPPTETGAFQYIRSSAIPVGFQDKFTWSFDVSAMTNPSGDGTIQICFIVLYGSNGVVYIVNPLQVPSGWINTDPPIPLTWRITDEQLSLFRTGLDWALFTGQDKTEWQPCTIEAPLVPVAGEIRIFLFAGRQGGGAFDDINIRFQNFRFEYRPYIGGSYEKYTGDYNKVSRTATGYNAKREKEVFIQDSAKPLFKGSLFFITNTREVFTGSVTFSAPTGINISGYHLLSFHPGQRIQVTGTALNDGDYTVVAVNYIIIGPFTQVVVKEPTLVNETVSCVIYEYLFELTTRWYTAAPFYTAPPPASNGAPPDSTYLHPYGYIQAFSVWNQYRNANRIFSTSVLGLGSMWCDALDKVLLTDTNPNTNNRYFLLISFEQNWKTALWSGVFIEDYSTVIPKNYDDPHEFKYLTQ